jgi:hypothetical protein
MTKQIALKGYVFMEGKVLWDKFTREGKVSDYLAYKNHVKSINGMEAEVTQMTPPMELTENGENQCFGISNKGTECR